jgi:hypothetical protein
MSLQINNSMIPGKGCRSGGILADWLRQQKNGSGSQAKSHVVFSQGLADVSLIL